MSTSANKDKKYKQYKALGIREKNKNKRCLKSNGKPYDVVKEESIKGNKEHNPFYGMHRSEIAFRKRMISEKESYEKDRARRRFVESDAPRQYNRSLDLDVIEDIDLYGVV